jgi:hypothetical protein
MVWPILISVAVTPRISAAGEAADQVSAASAPTTPHLVTKRINGPPLYVGRAQWRPLKARVKPALCCRGNMP